MVVIVTCRRLDWSWLRWNRSHHRIRVEVLHRRALVVRAEPGDVSISFLLVAAQSEGVVVCRFDDLLLEQRFISWREQSRRRSIRIVTRSHHVAAGVDVVAHRLVRHDWRRLHLRLLFEALLRRRTFDDVRKGGKHGRCGSRKLRKSRRYRVQISIDLLLILIQVQCRRRVANVLQVSHRVEFRQRADKGVNICPGGIRRSIAIQADVTEVIRVADCRRADRKNWLLCNEK